jgi:hypothetical protein
MLVTVMVMLLGYDYFFVSFQGFCGESPIYRTQFALYHCEYNDEASPDFQCHEYRKFTDFKAYLRWRFSIAGEVC